MTRYYDEIWVYGLKDVYEPLAALAFRRDVERRITYTGYLRREVPQEPVAHALSEDHQAALHPGHDRRRRRRRRPDRLGDLGLRGTTLDLEMPALIVFGPFVNRDRRRFHGADRPAPEARRPHLRHQDRAPDGEGGRRSSRWAATTPSARSCPSTSAALIVPRTRPRLEQYIRAVAAERLGLVSMLSDRDAAAHSGADGAGAAPTRPATAAVGGRHPGPSRRARPHPASASRNARPAGAGRFPSLDQAAE